MNLLEAYDICRKKAAVHMERMGPDLFDPSENRSGDYYEIERKGSFTSRWSWTASFVTGMAAILAQTDGDMAALKWANGYKTLYHDKVFAPYTQTMHDLGFLYLPYSVHLYRLTGDTDHRDTALRAAEELAKRFDVKGRFIEAWSEMNDSEPRDGRMIIDSCMNVPLLFWAWKETGHTFFYDVATAHLDTAVKMLVREDFSVCHAWKFDYKTGEPLHEINSCGYANGSHWARGTAWFVYGMAMAYEYTGEEKYLNLAVCVGEKYLECLGERVIPVWDFRLSNDMPAKLCSNNMASLAAHWDESKPENVEYVLDTSAAAIMICAFQLIAKHKECKRFTTYVDLALKELSEKYLNRDETIAGILSRSNGRDAFSIYGDYYYLHALASQIFHIETCWGV